MSCTITEKNIFHKYIFSFRVFISEVLDCGVIITGHLKKCNLSSHCQNEKITCFWIIKIWTPVEKQWLCRQAEIAMDTFCLTTFCKIMLIEAEGCKKKKKMLLCYLFKVNSLSASVAHI